MTDYEYLFSMNLQATMRMKTWKQDTKKALLYSWKLIGNL